MSAEYKDLVKHKDHDVVIAWYGDKEDPDNIAIECEDCHEVLFDKNNPRVDDPDPQEELEDAIDTEAFETLLRHAECDGVKILIRNGGADIHCNDCDTVLYSAKE